MLAALPARWRTKQAGGGGLELPLAHHASDFLLPCGLRPYEHFVRVGRRYYDEEIHLRGFERAYLKSLADELCRRGGKVARWAEHEGAALLELSSEAFYGW